MWGAFSGVETPLFWSLDDISMNPDSGSSEVGN
ncbi:MAG: hypothetical protein CEO12_511 [Parcubacteria group bacterium Gr01-1014_46]|nr:MAG: hypothetical protein CEO12_511 [Parcubacteria group bacterium Gr01-1014_46]